MDGLEVAPRRGEPRPVPGVLVLEGGAELAGAVVVPVVLEADVLARLDGNSEGVLSTPILVLSRDTRPS